MGTETAPENLPVPAPNTMVNLVENELALVQALYNTGGEVTPEIQAMITLSENALPAKIDGYGAMMDRIESERAHVKERINAYEKLMGGLEKAEDWMRDRLRDSMLTLGKEELLGADVKFKLMRAQPRLELDEAQLPAQLMNEKLTYAPDKVRIKALLSEGMQVPGARLIESHYVRQFLNNPVRTTKQKSKKTKTEENQNV